MPKAKNNSTKKIGRPSNEDSAKAEDHKYFCNGCRKGFVNRNSLQNHTKKCADNKKKSKNLKCMWCGMVFVNRGNLASHAFHIHGDSSYKAIISVESSDIKCEVCNQSFNKEVLRRIHIRKFHFNLKSVVPFAEVKKVNQIWFEKVMNSNKIIEIKKKGNNCLVLRKLDDSTSIKINNSNRETIDLTQMYPTNCSYSKKANCKHCNKSILKRDLKKHINEVHLNIKEHHCNNCLRSFKRVYQYLQHRCDAPRKLKGVKQPKNCDAFRICSVESLQKDISTT